ncbi:MAG: rhomboid family intramembrane serine protease, partial [Lachnospiraceae bacterium]|nr:rhomboid family intramembrane serine protease [Lachnospiraceae bacterium]
NAFSWVYDVSKKSIYIYENQVDDFYGLKRVLESAADYENIPDAYDETEYTKPTFKEQVKRTAAAVKTFPKVTTGLVLINVIVFVICTLTGPLLYNKGAAGLKLIESPVDVYRVITSMFLHIGVTHIFSNMLLLFFLGNVVEREVGSLLFAIMYLVSGIWGTVAIFIEEIVTSKDMVVVGASGAVFGLLGVLLSLVLFKRVTRATMPVSRVLFVIVLSVYNGFTQANIANTAHIGGLIAGFLFGVIFCLAKPIKKGEIPNEN